MYVAGLACKFLGDTLILRRNTCTAKTVIFCENRLKGGGKGNFIIPEAEGGGIHGIPWKGVANHLDYAF